MKYATSMTILAFGFAGSDSQSPNAIKIMPYESTKSTFTQKVTMSMFLKVTSKSEKTSNSGKSSRTTSNSAKSSKSATKKPKATKTPTVSQT